MSESVSQWQGHLLSCQVTAKNMCSWRWFECLDAKCIVGERERRSLCAIRQVRWTGGKLPKERRLCLCYWTWGTFTTPSSHGGLPDCCVSVRLFDKSYLLGRRNTGTVILVLCNISKATNISIVNKSRSGLEPSRFLDVFEILRFPRSAQNSPGTPSLNRWNHSAFKQQILKQHFSEMWKAISSNQNYLHSIE